MLLNLRLKQMERRWLVSTSPQYAMTIGQRILKCNSCHFNISILAQLNDCIGGLLHLEPNVITFRASTPVLLESLFKLLFSPFCFVSDENIGTSF